VLTFVLNDNNMIGYWKFSLVTYTVRPYQVFYSKILATLLPVIYCKKYTKTNKLYFLVNLSFSAFLQ